MTHDLKTWPEHFDAIVKGKKKHEIRVNDRAYQVGDTLHLLRYDNALEKFTGEELDVEVTWITRGGAFGLPQELCVMSIAKRMDWI